MPDTWTPKPEQAAIGITSKTAWMTFKTGYWWGREGKQRRNKWPSRNQQRLFDLGYDAGDYERLFVVWGECWESSGLPIPACIPEILEYQEAANG